MPMFIKMHAHLQALKHYTSGIDNYALQKTWIFSNSLLIILIPIQPDTATIHMRDKTESVFSVNFSRKSMHKKDETNMNN